MRHLVKDFEKSPAAFADFSKRGRKFTLAIFFPFFNYPAHFSPLSALPYQSHDKPSAEEPQKLGLDPEKPSSHQNRGERFLGQDWFRPESAKILVDSSI